jgi:RPA family protein
MNTQLPTTNEQQLKRKIAYKVRIGQINEAKQNLDGDRLRNIEINGKEIIRVNLIANIIDKYIQEGEKKYGNLGLDDASGQIKAKLFGDDTSKIDSFNQGDTVLVIGLIRSWNNELYLTPEIIKKKDPAFLLVRKLEVESQMPKTLDRSQIAELKDKILTMVKTAEPEGGIDIDKIIMDLKEPPNIINNEIKKLLEDGLCYEPRPGKLRYLG